MDSEKSIWIVEECSNPTTEYYILPALKVLGLEDRTRLLNIPPEEIINNPSFLIFVRYLTTDWINFIEKNKNSIKRIIYFMDDDLFDLSSWKGLPFRYKKKIYFKAYRWKGWLIKNKADFIVSTDFLAEKYKYLNPSIIHPYPIFNSDYSLENNEDSEFLKVFYHGTASHRDEINWLYDIVRCILVENDRIIFEIIGDKKVYDKFRNLKRVIIVHPMKWETYKKFLFKEKRHIGLAPLLLNKFNLGRSYTKFFEIVASGAAGIYSKESIYGKIISEKEGFLLENKKEEWINIILKLADDRFCRLLLYLNSIKKLENLKEIAEKIYKENLTWRFE